MNGRGYVFAYPLLFFLIGIKKSGYIREYIHLYNKV